MMVATLNVASFGGMFAHNHLAVVVTTNFIVKFLFGVSAMTSSYILNQLLDWAHSIKMELPWKDDESKPI